MPKILGEYIDRLCTVEMRRPGLPRGVARPLYEAALAEAGEPLSYRAASYLLEKCQAGKPVFITCNAGGPPYLPNGETDGPIGGATLARAISVATGAIPIFVATDYHAPPILAAAKANGLVVVNIETLFKRPFYATTHLPYNAVGDGTAAATALIDQYQPTAVIAIESLGPNENGDICSITGVPIADAPAYHSLFQVAAQRDIATVGIGDGGNEIGFGRIVEDVRRLHASQVGGSHVATVVATDVLVFAAVSNWGAYGVAAMLAFLSNKPNALHNAHTDGRMLDAALMAGAVDGGFANLAYSVDTIEGRISADLVNMLGAMVRMAREGIDRPF